MSQPSVILMWMALILFALGVVAALWRRDAPNWPASLACISAGLFLWALFSLLVGAH
jgi:hypothetical protein